MTKLYQYSVPPSARPQAMIRLAALVVSVLLIVGHARLLYGQSSPAAFVVASEDQPAAAIRIHPEASDRIREAAKSLSNRLGQIVGKPVVIRPGLEGQGIWLLLDDQAPGLPADAIFGDSIQAREAYLLRSEADRLLMVGSTELGLEHAVEDLLWRVGYRQFFPSAAWEIMPSQPDLAVTVDSRESPDFLSRRMSYGLGGWWRRGPGYDHWAVRNRMTVDDRASLVLRTSHMYAGFASSHEDVWAMHPEWLALLKNGKRPRYEVSQKFCISNREFRQFVREQVVENIRKNPGREVISMDPSDLGNWCICEHCKAMGSITDQAVTLANEAAEAITEAHGPGYYVGMHAYAQYAPPPNIEVHPAIIVSIATSLNGGHSVDDLIAGWSPKVSMLGIRDYWSVYPWDQDLPGRARAARLDYLATALPRYHAQGVRFMTTEASENWGPHGLGYYLASRILWDTDEADRVDWLIDDFLTRSFGPASEPMRGFYQAIHPKERPTLDKDYLASLYRLLAEARSLARGDEPIMRRLTELACYVHYIELYLAYRRADMTLVEREIPIDVSAQNAPELAEDALEPDAEADDLMSDLDAALDPEAAAKRLTVTVKNSRKQIAYEELAAWSWRTRKMGMTDSIGVWRDIPRRSSAVRLPIGATLETVTEHNRLKSDEPVTDEQIDAIIAAGIQAGSNAEH